MSKLKPICPACRKKVPGFTGDVGAGNSYSRFATVYICSGCGVQEALQGFFWRGHCPAHQKKPHHRRLFVVATMVDSTVTKLEFKTEAKAESEYNRMMVEIGHGANALKISQLRLATEWELSVPA